jgi:hypothetical protein
VQRRRGLPQAHCHGCITCLAHRICQQKMLTCSEYMQAELLHLNIACSARMTCTCKVKGC